MRNDHVKLSLSTILVITLLIIAPMTSCQNQTNNTNEKQENLLEYVVLASNEGYKHPDIEWGLSAEQVLETSHLADDEVIHMTEQNALRLKEDILFSEPAVEASVLYVFESDQLIGVDLLVPAEDIEALRTICQTVSEQAENHLPEPDANSLETLRQCENGVRWMGDDGSSVSMSLPSTQDDSDMVMIISVRSPRGKHE